MPKQFLSINEAASRLGVSTKTLRRWEEKGIITPKRTVGNQRRYSLADLDKANKQSLTINEAAKRLGLSAKTLRRWEEKGIITPQRTSGNQRRYAVSDIDVLKNQKPKAIVTPKIKKQAEKDLRLLEKERFFDIASVRTTPDTKNRPVVASFNPVVYNTSVITSNSEAISTNQAKISHPEFISGSPTRPQEIPNQVRNDNYKYRHLLSKKPFQYGFTFSSLLAVLLIITLLGKTDPAQLLASLPFADQLKVSSQKSEVDSQVLQSATTRRDFALRISVPVEMLSTASVSGNLTAPNILYSVLPGDNITISGDPQNPTISAVVEDLEQLGLVAGNGISFDGTTITNTAPGTDVDVFANIQVGSTTLSAGSNTDTFELAAGDNISLTTDTGSKKITIAADIPDTGSGNTIEVLEDGTTISNAIAALDFLGGDFDVGESPAGEANIQLASILTSVTGVAGNFDVGNDLTVGGNISVNGVTGSLTIGSDTINDISGPGLIVSGSTLQVNLTTLGGSGATSSNSGLEVGANGLTLLKGCSDTQILKWDDTNALWQCANDAGGGGSVGGTGATNQIAFWTDPSTLSGNDNFYWDNVGELLGIGTNGAPVAKLDVNGAATGKALVSLNETGDQHIFTASASGITQLYVDRSGNLAIEGALSDLSSSTLAINDALSVSGAISITGAISDSDSALLLDDETNIGSLANGINITTVGVISDNDGNVNINDSVDIAGNIDASGSLTSGNSNAFQVDANGNISSSGTTGITLSGDGAGLTFSGNNNHLISASSGTLQLGAATLTGTITGNGQNITGLGQLTVDNLELNGNTLSSTASDLILDSFSGTIQLADLTTNGIVYTSGGNGTLATEAQLAASRGGTGVDGSTASNGQLLIGNGAGFSLANLTAGSGITITNGAGSIQISQTGSGASKFTQSDTLGILYPNISTLDLLIGGTTSDSAKFAFLNNAGGIPVASVAGNLTLNSIGEIQTTNNQTLTLGGDATGNITLSPRNGSGTVRINGTTTLGGITYSWPGSIGANNYILQAQTDGTLAWIDPGTLPTANYWVLGDGILYPKNADVFDLLLGGEATTSAEFAITGINNGTPVATLSAITNAVGLSLTASTGTIQSLNYATLTLGGDTTGNIAIAPKNGNGTLALNVGALTINGLPGENSLSPTCVSVTNGIVTGLGDCGPGSGGSVWTFNTTDGTLYPINNTMDLLFGGAATNSAKFAFLNTAGGTPTASISANNGANALSFAGDGTIGTTNKQTLTLGTASTGDINLVIGAGNNLRINGTPGADVLAATCVTAVNGIVTGTGSCTTPLSSFIWSTSTDGGAIIQGNITRDLLIGGEATESAKFAILNVTEGTPTASVAGALGAAYLTANGELRTTNNQTLSIGGTDTGHIVLDSGNNVIRLADLTTNGVVYTSGGNGTLNTEAVLDVSRGGTGINAASVTDGQILIGNDASNGFTLANLTAGTGITITNGAGAITISQNAVGLSKWIQNETDGTLYPSLSTLDLLVGGTATTSAKFAVLNVAGGTPIASVSAGLAGGAYLTANGELSTTNKQTLTLGTSSTGNILVGSDATARSITIGSSSTTGLSLTDDNWSITAAGLATFEQLAVNNLRLDGNTLDTTSGNLILDSTGGITRLADLTTDGVVFTLNGDGTLDTEAQLDISRGGTGLDGTTATNGQLLIGNDGGNGFTLANLTPGAGISITNGAGSITIAQTETGGSKWTQNATDGTLYPNIATLDLLIGGVSTQSAKFAVLNVTDGVPSASVSAGVTGATYLTADGALKTTNNQTLTIGGIGTGNLSFLPQNGTGFSTFNGGLGVNTTNLLGSLDIRPDTTDGGTLPIGYFSGDTSSAGLVVDNSGSGDLFTASASGVTRFTIAQNGNLILPAYAGTNSVLYVDETTSTLTSLTTASVNQCLVSGENTPSWVSCAAAGSNWEVTDGSIKPKFASVLDLLIGGTATDTAKFAVLNVNPDSGGTPTASVSAGVTGATYLTADGALKTTNNQTLTIGGIGTGNLSFLPQNGTGFSTFNGGLGVNTTNLLGSLDIRPDTTDGGTLPIGYFSGDTSSAGLVVDNSGSGDLFTASSSGLTRFTIHQNGTIAAPNYAGTNAVLYAQPTTGLLATATTASPDLCLVSGATTPMWTACPGASSGGGSNWTLSAATGTIYPINTTVDLLIGGSSSSSAKFHVYGTTNDNGTQPVASVSANTSFAGFVIDNRVGDIFTASSSGLTRFVIQNNGNVGIGTANPQYALELASSVATSQYIKFNPVTNDDWRIGADGFGLSFINDTDGQTRMTIDENGNVGIGTTDPTVGAFAQGLDISSDGAGPALALTNTATNGKKFIIGSVDSPAGLYFRDDTAGAYRMVIDTNGKIGINTGTSNVLGTLDLRANTAHQPIASLSGNTSFAGLIVDNASGNLFAASSSGLTRFVIAQNGNVGIGTANPSSNVHIIQSPTQEGLRIDAANAGLDGALAIYDPSGSIALSYLGAFQSTSIYGGVSAFDTPALGVRANVGDAIALKVGNLPTLPFFGTAAVASISGNTSFATLVIDNNGVGDIFTASSSGLPRFTINNNGNVGIGTILPSTKLEVSGSGNQFARITSTDSNDAGIELFRTGGGLTDWRIFNNEGALRFGNSTDDLSTVTVRMSLGNGQLGLNTGTATSLATLDVRGNPVNGGTRAVASVSGQTSFAALVVDNNSANGDIFTASRSGQTKFTIGLDRVQIGTGSATGAGGAETPQLLGLDSKGSTGDPTNGRQGDMYYNTVDEKFRCYQGSGWRDCIAISQAEYLRAEDRTDETDDSEIAAGDHIQFDTVANSSGASISLDTSTSYTDGAGASIGRFTLTAGRTYRLVGSAQNVSFDNGDASSSLDIRWYNLTAGSGVGSTGSISPDTRNFSGGGGDTAEAIITTTQTTTVELRITYSSAVAQIGYAPSNLYPNAYIQVLSGAQEVSASEYLFAYQSVTNTTNLTTNDHVKFDTNKGSSGTSISLNTGAYGSGGGRFTLAAGKTYRLEGQISRISSAGDQVNYQWYDVTHSTVLGTNGYTSADGGPETNAEAIITTTETTVVELRYVNFIDATQIVSNDVFGLPGPTAYIEVISDGTKVAQLIGATSSTNGVLGFIPAPVAGQQGSLLLGNGTWTNRNNLFIGTNLTEPIASMSARTSFAGLVVDNQLGDLFTASSSGRTRFTISQNGDVTINQGEGASTYVKRTTGQYLEMRTNASGNQFLSFSESGNQKNVVFGIDGNSNGFSWNTGVTTTGIGTQEMFLSTIGTLGIGTGSPLASLDVRAQTATFPLVSFSGSTNAGFPTLVINQTGAGDIFAASDSGSPMFTISNGGKVTMGTTPQSAVGYNQLISASSQASNDVMLRLWKGDASSTSEYFMQMMLTGTSDNKFLFRSDGQGLADATWTTPATDFAEYFYSADTSLEKGDLVSLSAVAERKLNGEIVGTVEAASGSAIPLGVVSTAPGFLGALHEDGIDGLEDYENNPHYKKIGLVGQLPLKVTDKQGSIKPGDLIGTSSLPKYGAKVKSTETKTIIGRSLDAFPGPNCPAVASVNDIVWPTDERGTNPGNPCFTLPDGSHVGKIMVFLHQTTYDPQIYLTGSGNINIFEQAGAQGLEAASIYGVNMHDGSEVIRTGVFSEAVVGNLRTGSLDVQSLSLGGINLNDRLLGLEGIASNSANFASPLQTQIESLNFQLSSLNSKIASLEARLDLLTASGSAFFNPDFGNFTASSGAELSLDSLEVNGNILADSLNVLRYTTMNELSVTGSIRTGVLTIKGQSNGGASISTLNGDLRLQDEGFGGIDILDGLMTIDTSGNVQTVGEITAKKFNVDTSSVSGASAGSVTISAGVTVLDVDTTALTADSLIFVTPNKPVVIGAERKDANTFTIRLQSPAATSIKVNWWIVN